MPRPVWTGSISFGLVNIPITLVSATESHRVGFHEFERGTKERIHYRRVSERSGREVPWEKIEKGFEVAKGRYVILTDDELEAAEPRKSHTIDIERFVPLQEIDPVNWDQTYYVGPDGEAARKAYGLLWKAMEKSGRVAIGRFVMRTKEYVVCIRPFQEILALHTMYFADEVRKTKDLGFAAPKAAASKQELALAEQLIDSLGGHWDPTAYRDTFKERVMELVRKKDGGEDIAVAEPAAAPAGGQVIDLMKALKATLAGKHAAKPGGKNGEHRGPHGKDDRNGRPGAAAEDGGRRKSGKSDRDGDGDGARADDTSSTTAPARRSARARSRTRSHPQRKPAGRAAAARARRRSAS